MQKTQQLKIRSRKILATATFAVTGILSGCDGRMPTDVSPPPAEIQFDETEGPRCFLINGQIYCN